MKSKPFALLAASSFALALFVAGLPLAHGDDPAPAAGFKSMFNGKDLTGWDGLDDFWTVKDGVISGSETKEHAAPQTFLIYKDAKFGDFELHYKYRFTTPDGNSGLQFRSKVLDEKQHRVGGYQADCDAKQEYDGTIYDEGGIAGGRGGMSGLGKKTSWDAETKRHDEDLGESAAELKKLIKPGDWNDVVLVAQGNHVTYTINGHLMTDLTDNSPKALREGVIALQLHAGFVMEVQYKDIEIKDLSAATPAK